jgi:hypothetical protein
VRSGGICLEAAVMEGARGLRLPRQLAASDGINSSALCRFRTATLHPGEAAWPTTNGKAPR